MKLLSFDIIYRKRITKVPGMARESNETGCWSTHFKDCVRADSGFCTEKLVGHDINTDRGEGEGQEGVDRLK